REEQRPRKKLSDMLREQRIRFAFDQPAPHDDMIAQIFHHGQRKLRLVCIYLRSEPRSVSALDDERFAFDPCAVERQRPRFADDLRIRQRLLQDESLALAVLLNMKY